eukprot:2259565-Amphidinium_carterae.1
MRRRGLLLRRYRKLGCQVKGHVRSGVSSVGVWGSHITGCSPTLLHTVRQGLFRAMHHVSTRSQPYLAIAVRGDQGLDPARVIHGDVLREFVFLILGDDFDEVEVQSLLAHSMGRLARSREPWLTATTFMDNVVMTLCRLGWSIDTVDTWTSDLGRVLRLREVGAKRIQLEAHRATQRWADRCAMHRGGFPSCELQWAQLQTVCKGASRWGQGCLSCHVA